MDFYMVVRINPSDGTFEDDPEYFDTKREAVAHHEWLRETHADLTYAVYRCEEVMTP